MCNININLRIILQVQLLDLKNGKENKNKVSRDSESHQQE